MILNDSDSSFLRMHAVEQIQIEGGERARPSFLFRPTLSREGNLWCALYGSNLMEGVAGFGNSPSDAMLDFDMAWHNKLPDKAKQETVEREG